MGTRRVSAFAVVAVGLLTAVLLAGCGAKAAKTTAAPGPSGSSSGPSSSSFSSSADAGATPEPGVTPSTAKPTSTAPVTVPSLPERSFNAGGSETLVGDLEDGVEPNCLLLRTSSNKLYQLVGGDRSKLKLTNKHVTIDGREIPGMATTCQQGTPFLVTNVHTS